MEYRWGVTLVVLSIEVYPSSGDTNFDTKTGEQTQVIIPN
jgi:hypothetical protein